MGLREFKDSDGIVWQVWTVTADVLDKRTAAEDYMRDWQDGWLCFEHSGGRKRLAHFPADWESLPDEERLVLLARALSLVEGCPCGSGCPACVGPALETEIRATGPTTTKRSATGRKAIAIDLLRRAIPNLRAIAAR